MKTRFVVGKRGEPVATAATTPRPIASVAEEIGYVSEAAFNRAFKREFGSPPATWRRHACGGGAKVGSDASEG